ncbi:MAG: ATP-binding protein [Thermodesulfobacteriota bacterium]
MDWTDLEQVGLDDPHRYKEMFGMFLESIPSSVLLISRDLRVVFANRNFFTKSRRVRQEVIGQRLEQVLPEAIIEHIDMTGRVRQVFEKNQSIRGDRMTYRAPGIPIRIYYYRILPFAWRGEVENAILMMDDVTEQVRLSEEVRRVERHLAGVVECARDMVLSTDPDGCILTWNTAAEKLTGYRSWEVKGRPFFERCISEKLDELKDVFRKLMIGDSSQTGEWEIVTKGEARIPISWVFSAMKDERDHSIGVVAVGRDLSEHRKLEMQLLQSQKLAALGVMAGGIAHEIRNPLAVCSSAAQFLKNPDIKPELHQECIARILDGIHKASAIIENLLRFARPSSTTEMAAVSLLDVIRDSLQLVSNQAKIEKISLSVDFPEQDMSVYANANLLQQMFLNLFLNAINSMPNGGRLTISAHRSDDGAQVRIEDTGCGIRQQDLQRIFDPFFTLSPVGRGTGLGLSICYSIVKQHLGNILVESAEGQGTVFSVHLPLL